MLLLAVVEYVVVPHAKRPRGSRVPWLGVAAPLLLVDARVEALVLLKLKCCILLASESALRTHLSTLTSTVFSNTR